MKQIAPSAQLFFSLELNHERRLSNFISQVGCKYFQLYFFMCQVVCSDFANDLEVVSIFFGRL